MNSLNEEQEILESVENGEWRSIPNVQQEIQRYQRYAQETILEIVNIEIPTSDLQSWQSIAQQTNTSVSSLMANVLHQYIVRQSSS